MLKLYIITSRVRASQPAKRDHPYTCTHQATHPTTDRPNDDDHDHDDARRCPLFIIKNGERRKHTHDAQGRTLVRACLHASMCAPAHAHTHTIVKRQLMFGSHAHRARTHAHTPTARAPNAPNALRSFARTFCVHVRVFVCTVRCSCHPSAHLTNIRRAHSHRHKCVIHCHCQCVCACV